MENGQRAEVIRAGVPVCSTYRPLPDTMKGAAILLSSWVSRVPSSIIWVNLPPSW